MEREWRVKVAVLGSSSVAEDSPVGCKAFEIGKLVADRGAVLLTGGCPGLPHAAVQGARSAGGLTVAVSPAMNRKEHAQLYCYPHDSQVVLFTGMGTKGRNVILVRSADACVFIGGGMGTLNEFTIAMADLGTRAAIGVLTGTGGLSDELPRLVSLTDQSPQAFLLTDSDPRRLLQAVFDHLHQTLPDDVP
ncbi:MAG: LOG family protein [Desulfomonile tiedjei]|nr:LOG family protein [Desulfomonile tiedjei]